MPEPPAGTPPSAPSGTAAPVGAPVDSSPVTAQHPERVLPAAVLWDMDGTIIDTEPIWQQSQVELTDRYGAEWTHEDGLSLVGSGLERSVRSSATGASTWRSRRSSCG